MSRVLVTGGTGNLGRELVPRLVAAGHEVSVLSRKANPAVATGVDAVRGDLRTGDGLAAAVAGADVIVHCASGAGDAAMRGLTYRYAKVTDVDATARLLAAAKTEGSTPHIVYISIVGVDKIPLGYYRAKLDAERVIEGSGLPHTILRTTQWHTLAAEFCRRMTRGPVVVVPKKISSQLLDVGEVAERMTSLVARPPSGRAEDMGGPRVLTFEEIARAYLAAAHLTKRVITMRLPGKAASGFAEGHNLTPQHADGTITWDDWLGKNAPVT